jgi:serine phosphatase RsbU (regulator of sigma subunit)
VAAPGQWGSAGAEDALRLQQLAEATALLAATETLDEITHVIVSRVSPVVGAALAVVMLREGDELHVVASHGLSEKILQRWQRFRLDVDTPASQAVHTGRPVIVTAADEINRMFPALEGAAPPDRTVVCMPMRVERSAIGVLALSFNADWTMPQYELDFFATFADSCAQAVRRVQATEAARLRARRLAFLADASEELASSLDYRATLQNVARLVVPDLADWCSIELLEDGELRTVAVGHQDPEKMRWAWELNERYPPRADSQTGTGRVLRTGRSELYAQVTDEMLVAGAQDEEHLRLARELNLSSALTVPLAARGRVLGTLRMIRAETPGVYGEEELAVAEDLAHRAALAIENSLLYRQAHDVALQLQHAVLPERLDALPGWQLSASYRPGHSAEVGGDFYDAIALSPSRIAVFIGDVMGHGLPAAAAMAAMRSAVRAYLSIDPAPEVVAGKLDRMFARLDMTQLVTLVYGILDADLGEWCFVNLGHLPPLVLSDDGAAQLVTTAPSRPLGAGGDERIAVRVPFRNDDTLLLYTDGLVERRGEIVDVGLERLLGRANVLAADDLDEALRSLVDGLEQNPDDDVTAIAVRRGRDVAHG